MNARVEMRLVTWALLVSWVGACAATPGDATSTTGGEDTSTYSTPDSSTSAADAGDGDGDGDGDGVTDGGLRDDTSVG